MDGNWLFVILISLVVIVLSAKRLLLNAEQNELQRRQIDQICNVMPYALMHDKTGESEIYHWDKLPKGRYVLQFANLKEQEVLATRAETGRHYVQILDVPADVLTNWDWCESKELP